MNGDGGAPVLRQLSVRAVMDVLLRAGATSRADLAKITGLSKQTMSQVIRALEEQGLVRVRGVATGRVGRSAITYEVNEDAGFVLGVDVGATSLRMVAAGISGLIVAEREVPTDSGDAGRIIAQIEAVKAELVAKASLAPDRLLGAVVATPGVVHPLTGQLSLAPNLPALDGVNLLDMLARRLGCPVAIENDINCAAVGENWRGRGRDADSLAFISLGTGIGLGLLIDGRLVRGRHGAAGEISYLPFGSDPYMPLSLERGALECAIGAAGISQRYHMAGGAAGTPVREIMARAQDGERMAAVTVAETARIAALLVLSVAALFDPERIILGGNIGGGADFVALIRAALPECSRQPITIEESALGVRATVIGALALALTRLHNDLFTPQDLPAEWRLPGVGQR